MFDPDSLQDGASYGIARLMFASIGLSPLLLAAVMWLYVGKAELSVPPGLAAWVVWGVFGAGGLAVWALFRGKAVEPMTEWTEHRRRAEGLTLEALHTHLIAAWAGAEGVGLAGVVAYFFLGGTLAMLVGSLAVFLLCLALSAPREAWYRELEREDGGAGAG